MNTVAHNISTMQDTTEGEHKVNKGSLDRYIRHVINEHGHFASFGIRLKAGELPREEQLIFLSRICPANEYAWYMSTDRKRAAAIRFYKQQMQDLIDVQIPVVWKSVENDMDKWEREHMHRRFNEPDDPYERHNYDYAGY